MNNKSKRENQQGIIGAQFICGLLIVALCSINTFLFKIGPDTWIWWAIVLCSIFGIYYGDLNGKREQKFMRSNHIKTDDEIFNLTFCLDTSAIGILLFLINAFAYPACAIAYGITIFSFEFWVNAFFLSLIEAIAKASGKFYAEIESTEIVDSHKKYEAPDYEPVEKACGSYIAAEAKKMVESPRQFTKTGRKTSYPVIIKKYEKEETSLLFFPDFNNYIVWTKSMNEKDLEADAEYMLRCLIDSVKLSEKQLPFSSDINDLTVLEGEYKKMVIVHKEGSAVE